MIDNCGDCKTKCCRSGPGPYRIVPPKAWLFKLQGSQKYNSMCANFDPEKGICKAWNTGDIPIVCKTYVCGLRTYSKEELEKIDYLLELISKGKT